MALSCASQGYNLLNKSWTKHFMYIKYFPTGAIFVFLSKICATTEVRAIQLHHSQTSVMVLKVHQMKGSSRFVPKILKPFICQPNYLLTRLDCCTVLYTGIFLKKWENWSGAKSGCPLVLQYFLQGVYNVCLLLPVLTYAVKLWFAYIKH